MMLLATTLSMAAAAALINIWLSMRIGRLRHAAKISVGDGGHELLARRMRAQLNFAENVPIVLVLIAAIELTGKGDTWLPWVGIAFMVGRIAHGFGMDGGSVEWGRGLGTALTMLTQLGLAVVAVLVVLGII